MRVFGCLCYVTVTGPNAVKLDPRAFKAIFLGYASTQKGYKVYNLSTHKVIVSRDVIFYESVFPYLSTPSNILVNEQDSQVDLHSLSDIVDHHDNNEDSDKHADVDMSELGKCRTSKRSKTKSTWLNDYVSNAVSGVNKHFTSPHLRDTFPFTELPNSLVPYAAFLANIADEQEPCSYKQASGSKKWIQAIDKELQALKETATWDLVDLPKGKKLIGCKWVYKIKRNPDGIVKRYKTRLVAKGFTQIEGGD
ncbi:transmembrane signal receptor [Lithospermum erythrorhizon]|uniref:Transmembrane signal receptor n=1 Tax=Lithospermum erythrorhizon TaxID=34254 RepID=A0AAV3NZT0_LITER